MNRAKGKHRKRPTLPATAPRVVQGLHAYQAPTIREVLVRFGLEGSHFPADWARGVLQDPRWCFSEFEGRALAMVAAGISDPERRITFDETNEEFAERKKAEDRVRIRVEGEKLTPGVSVAGGPYERASDESPSLAEAKEASRAASVSIIQGGSVLQVLEHVFRCRTGERSLTRCEIPVKRQLLGDQWFIAPLDQWRLCPIGYELRSRIR